MQIKSKMKTMLALCAAVLVASFAFAATITKTNVIWDEGKTFNADSEESIELGALDVKVGDAINIYVEKAGATFYEEVAGARAAGPMHELARNGVLKVHSSASDSEYLLEETLINTEAQTYTLNVTADNIDKFGDNTITVIARKLTITKIEVVSSEEVAEALVNADFSQSIPLDNHLCGYGKDMAAQNTTYYGLQDVEGWNKVVVAGVKDEQGYENSGLGGGVFAYGSEWQMKGYNKTAPAAGPNGEAGQALGFFGVWGNGGYYYQDIVLPAGKYTFMTYIYNQSGTQANTSQTGFFVNNQAVASVAINTAVGAWTLQTADFELTEQTVGQVRVGYVSTGAGSSANPMLFFDCVKILSELDAAKEAYQAALDAANAATSDIVTGEENQTLANAIAANSNIDMASVEAVKAATEALKAATEAYKSAIPAYQALADAKAIVAQVELEAWPYASAEKKTAAQEALNVTATSAADATTKKDAMLQAYRAFIESNATAEGVEGAQVIADAIVNPAAENGTNGWTLQGHANVKDNEPWTDAAGNAEHKYFDSEQWGDSSWDITLSQDITLTSGRYVLTAIVRASTDVTMTLFAGNERKQATVVGATGNVFDRGWNDVFVPFEVFIDGTVNIGVQGVTNAVHNWMSFSNFRLVRIGDSDAGAALAAAKDALQAEITAAEALLNEPTNTEGRDAFSSAINTAKALLESTDAETILAGIQPLKDAEKAFLIANKPLNDGKYYFINAAFEPSVMIAAGNTWGTRGIVNEQGLDLNVVYNEDTNTYTFDTNIYQGNSHFLGSNLFMDSNAFGWTIERDESGWFCYITAIINGTKNYVGVDINSELILRTEMTDDVLWYPTPAADFEAQRLNEMDNASETNPVDATFLLKDANFNRNDHRWEAWTITEGLIPGQVNLGGGCSEENGNGNAEVFHQAFTLSQTATNAVAGTYELTAQGFYRQDGDAEEAPEFFFNDKAVKMAPKAGEENSMTDASVSFSAGQYTIDPIRVYIPEGQTLTVGVRATGNSQWVIFDNFQLTYLGAENCTEEAKQLADAKAALQALVDAENEANRNSESYTEESWGAYSAALDAANAALADTEATVESLTTAKTNLEAAIEGLTEKGEEPFEPTYATIYSWQSPEGTVSEEGGTISYENGDGNRLNYPNGGFYTICLNGKKANMDDTTPSANAGYMLITLNEALVKNSIIEMDAYITKSSSTVASAYFVFENGTTLEGVEYGDDANINEAFSGVITTTKVTIPDAAVGSKTIKMTRSKTGTNLFITKLVISKPADATGISTVSATRQLDGAVYNLRGQRVEQPTKGLYIIGGKKVVIK